MLLICIYEFRIWLTAPSRLARHTVEVIYFHSWQSPKKIFDFPFNKNSTAFEQICGVMLRYKTKAKPPHPFSPPLSTMHITSMINPTAA
jgi:hypothetical protein